MFEEINMFSLIQTLLKVHMYQNIMWYLIDMDISCFYESVKSLKRLSPSIVTHSVIPALERLGQRDYKFEISLGYFV
jgi:hypothetical protein